METTIMGYIVIIGILGNKTAVIGSFSPLFRAMCHLSLPSVKQVLS